MSGPDVVRIKRKRNEPAPDALLVERPGKRQQTTDVHYVLQKDKKHIANSLFDITSVKRQLESRDDQAGHTRAAHVPGNGMDGSNTGRRVFHLKRPSTPETGVRKKRRHKDDGIATFIEKQVQRNDQDLLNLAQHDQPPAPGSPASESLLKRPGKGSAIRVDSKLTKRTPSSNASGCGTTDSRIEIMVKSLHHFAMEEAAKETPLKPKVAMQPRLPAQRSRELHRQRMAQSRARPADQEITGDMEMDDEADYVYDTYVLALSSGVGATHIDSQDGTDNVGYLVITAEDEDVWETYIEDEPSEPSDEDDENAEDWYGADYPDDELATDDEFDRNPYHYRENGSDDEWEENGTFSDDEYERQTQPWRKKTPQQFSKYFSDVENKAEE